LHLSSPAAADRKSVGGKLNLHLTEKLDQKRGVLSGDGAYTGDLISWVEFDMSGMTTDKCDDAFLVVD
jgi:hypothetical protein